MLSYAVLGTVAAAHVSWRLVHLEKLSVVIVVKLWCVAATVRVAVSVLLCVFGAGDNQKQIKDETDSGRKTGEALSCITTLSTFAQ